MLNIQDLNLLKITKVKYWAVYFDYDNEKYLLHGSSDDFEYCVKLYKRVPIDNFGKYELEYIYGEPYCTDYIKSHFIKYFGKQLCYKKIKKEYFVKKLTFDGFCHSLYDDWSADSKEKLLIQKMKLNSYKIK